MATLPKLPNVLVPAVADGDNTLAFAVPRNIVDLPANRLIDVVDQNTQLVRVHLKHVNNTFGSVEGWPQMLSHLGLKFQDLLIANSIPHSHIAALV